MNAEEKKRYFTETALALNREGFRAETIVSTTAEYMRQMEQAHPLKANGLTGDYRILADFNGTVLTHWMQASI